MDFFPGTRGKTFLLVLTSVTGLCQASWRQTAGPDGNEILCLAESGGILFAGTRDSGIYRSEDDGATWTQANLGLAKTSVHFLAGSSGILFASTASGTYRSQDRGGSWGRIDFPSMESCESGITALAPRRGVLFAGTGGCGVFQSKDGGYSWSPLQAGNLPARIRAMAAGGEDLFVGAYPGGVYRSSDNGATWTEVNKGLSSPSITALLMKELTLFAGTEDGGLYRTGDRGKSWVRVGGGWSGSGIRSLARSEDNLVVAIRGEGFFRTTDMGETWVHANAGAPTSNPTALAAIGTTLFAGTDGFGVWKFPLPRLDKSKSPLAAPNGSIATW